jgi:rhodanese-related sulfurtransferase
MNSNDLLQYAVPVLLIVGFLVFKRMGQVSSAQARELVKQGAALVDVRSPGEFSTGHLPGAQNIPVQELGAKLSSLGPKDQPIVLYCASGTRSAMARGVLKSQGFTQVYNLGAMGRW